MSLLSEQEMRSRSPFHGIAPPEPPQTPCHNLHYYHLQNPTHLDWSRILAALPYQARGLGSQSSSPYLATSTSTTNSNHLSREQFAALLFAACASEVTQSAKSAGKLRITTGASIRRGKGASASHSPSVSKRSRVCAECHTSHTLQWRQGPDGHASLCNACGQRFQRRKQAQLQKQHSRLVNHHPEEEGSLGDCCPEPMQKVEPRIERRSNIYSLLN